MGVSVRGGVPRTTNLTKKDTSNTTIVGTLGRVCYARLDSGRVYRVNIGVNTSLPFYLANNALLTRNVNSILDGAGPLGEYFVILTGPSCSMGAKCTCHRFSSVNGVHAPSGFKVLYTVRDNSLGTVYSGLSGIFRRFVRIPREMSVGRAVQRYKTVNAYVDKDNPAICNVFRGGRSTRRTYSTLGPFTESVRLYEPISGNYGVLRVDRWCVGGLPGVSVDITRGGNEFLL